MAFSGSAPISPGPETVINPEKRGLPAASNTEPLPGGSTIWHILFPREAPLADNEAPPRIAGLKLAHFEIEERIGVGGMGAVFRGRDERLDRTVAIKVLGPSQVRDPASVQRFQNEARAAARLDHDNIVRVFFIGEDSGVPFIAYEFVTGTNIRNMIRSKGRLDPAEAVNYTLQIAQALKHTSAFGVVHRDIKPSNIIVTGSGRAKLVDLGLARKAQPEQVSDLTMAGTTLGTFDYISPEQAKDPRNVDVRSDIYSLGCTLYHMLTGAPPYPEGTVLQKLLDHQGSKAPDPSLKNPAVSRRLAAVVQKMMASDPDERYQRPEDVTHDLLVVAGTLGLRGMNPDGLIWTMPKQIRPKIWEHNVGWIATAAALLLIFLILQIYPTLWQPRLGTQLETKDQRAQVASATSSDESSLPGDVSATGAPTDVAPKQLPESTALVDEKKVAAVDPGNNVAPSAGGSADPLTPPETVFPPPGAEGGTGPVASDPFARLGKESPFGKPNPDALADRKLAPADSIPPTASSPNNAGALDVDGTATTAVEAPKPTAGAATAGLDPGERSPKNAFRADEIPPPVIALMSAGHETESFPTLEAACREARDGDIIVLNYDGKRPAPPEKPIRLENKRLTIRAGRHSSGKLYRPAVEFDTKRATGDETVPLFSLTSASVDLFNLDLRVSLENDRSASDWSMFALGGTDQVRVRGSRITVVNPQARRASVFDLRPGMRPDMIKMTTSASGARSEISIEIAHSLVRGNCNLLSSRYTHPARLKIGNSILALEGSLVSMVGDLDMPDQDADLEISLEHVTCLVGNSLIRMDGGEEPRELLPVSVQAANNIFATNAPAPLIAVSGKTSAQMLRGLLRWEGEKNFYDRFQKFWAIRPTQIASADDEYDFAQWQKLWGVSGDVGANYGGILWASDRWTAGAFADVVPADVSLEEGAENPANAAATDDTNVGADATNPEFFSDVVR